MTIHPYRDCGMWVFDDESVGLWKEPLVRGADKVCDMLAEDIPGAENGFDLMFEDSGFATSIRLDWLREEDGWNLYFCPELGVEGWLCPALLLYYSKAPQHLYISAGYEWHRTRAERTGVPVGSKEPPLPRPGFLRQALEWYFPSLARR